MARTIRIKLYKFSELSEAAQQKAIENNYGINVDYEWWEGVYMDAENIGLKITSFDIDRGSYCNGEFIETAQNTANKILSEHGEVCETYKTAQEFLNECQKLQDKAEIENKDGDEEYWFQDEIEDLENEFLKSLCEDYRIILSNEYDYLTSAQAIKETIEANEYEFTSEGNRY